MKATTTFRVRGNKEFWNTSIEELDLSQRPFGALKRAKINTFDELTNRWSKLNKVSQLGSTSIKEIKNKFINYYLEKCAEDDKSKAVDFVEDLTRGVIAK